MGAPEVHNLLLPTFHSSVSVGRPSHSSRSLLTEKPLGLLSDFKLHILWLSALEAGMGWVKSLTS